VKAEPLQILGKGCRETTTPRQGLLQGLSPSCTADQSCRMPLVHPPHQVSSSASVDGGLQRLGLCLLPERSPQAETASHPGGAASSQSLAASDVSALFLRLPERAPPAGTLRPPLAGAPDQHLTDRPGSPASTSGSHQLPVDWVGVGSDASPAGPRLGHKSQAAYHSPREVKAMP